MRSARVDDLCRASLIAVLMCALAACSTLERPIAQRLPAPIEPTPPPPFDINAIPDAVPRVEPRSAHGNPPFYTAMGKRYYVLGASDGYVERGVASWYGPTFHGVSTSSGERYDMYGMTAAHKTLPLPTYVRVTNLRNGRTITVQDQRSRAVCRHPTDRPFLHRGGEVRHAPRRHDLRGGPCARAGRHAGQPYSYLGNSAADVYTYRQAHSRTRAMPSARSRRLRAAGLATAFIAPPANDKPLLYRVRIGPINDVAAFDQLSARLATLGFAGARLAMD